MLEDENVVMEQTTSEPTVDTEMDLFGDNELDTDTEQTEEITDDAIETTTEEKPEENQQTDEQLYEVKYNGQVQKLTMQELITNAQKGMNYDHVKAEKDALANSKEIQALDYFAQLNGMNRTQYAEYLLQEKERIAVENEAERVVEQYPSIPNELAEEIAKIRLNEIKKKEAEEAKAAEEAKNAEDNKKYQQFIDAYPEIKDYQKDIPQEVWEEVSKGKDLLTAYQAYENKQLKLQLETLKQNQTNKKKAIGSVTGDTLAKTEDDFLKGLFD